MPYPGGKNGAGVYQQIINRMPPHSVYIEPFLGGGAIMRLKRPAALNIGIDRDPRVIAHFCSSSDASSGDGSASTIVGSGAARSLHDNGSHRQERRVWPENAQFRFECADALVWLRDYRFIGDELVYCDPPYLLRTRTRLNLYAHEMTDLQHAELLDVVCSLPCMVVISGYWNRLYARELDRWASASFQTVNRAGKPATEWLWMNFPEPTELHDYSYLGSDYRERERIKRKKNRWTAKLAKMPRLERQALLAAIADTAGPSDATGIAASNGVSG